MMPPRRKKWTEAEEKTLIDKYGELISNGTLAKMKTREKKFKPIACHVNVVHHMRDPITYPWQWTWKDVSTKVQNMRHQYLLVKQKIKKAPELIDNPGNDCDMEGFDWMEGLTHWSNFLRYKEVFGDMALVFSSNGVNDSAVIGDGAKNNGLFAGGGQGIEMDDFGQIGHSGEGDFGAGIDEGEHVALGLGFEGEGEEVEVNCKQRDAIRQEEVDPSWSTSKKKRKAWKGLEKRAWGFILKQFGQLRELESRFEQREEERERERKRRDHLRTELDQEWELKLEQREKEREDREKIREGIRRQRIKEWESMEKESEERERRRREDQLMYEREWEESLNRRRLEWKKRMDERLSQHRAEMDQMQNRILHEQQNLTSQLLGIVSQWTGHPTGLSDHTAASNHYLSQMMQNLHNVNGMVHGETRVDEDNQDDQFIVDG